LRGVLFSERFYLSKKEEGETPPILENNQKKIKHKHPIKMKQKKKKMS
jgi:hypothetical protein